MNTNTRHDNIGLSPLSTVIAQRVKRIHYIPNTISMSNSICRDKMDTCTAIQHQGMICSQSNYHERVSCKHHYITQIVVKTTTHSHVGWMRPRQTKDKDIHIIFHPILQATRWQIHSCCTTYSLICSSTK